MVTRLSARRRAVRLRGVSSPRYGAPVLFLSLHALMQMESRYIDRAEILEALANRETVYPSADDDSTTVVLGRTGSGRRLKVVVSNDDEEHVITVAGRGEDG